MQQSSTQTTHPANEGVANRLQDASGSTVHGWPHIVGRVGAWFVLQQQRHDVSAVIACSRSQRRCSVLCAHLSSCVREGMAAWSSSSQSEPLHPLTSLHGGGACFEVYDRAFTSARHLAAQRWSTACRQSAACSEHRLSPLEVATVKPHARVVDERGVRGTLRTMDAGADGGVGPTSGCSDQATHKEGVYDCNGARLHAGRPVGTGLVRLSDFVMRERSCWRPSTRRRHVCRHSSEEAGTRASTPGWPGWDCKRFDMSSAPSVPRTGRTRRGVRERSGKWWRSTKQEASRTTNKEHGRTDTAPWRRWPPQALDGNGRTETSNDTKTARGAQRGDGQRRKSRDRRRRGRKGRRT